MTDTLLDYALDHLNAGRGDPNRQARSDQRLFAASDIRAVRCTDHADPVTKTLIAEVRVTLLATGAVLYLPLPAGYAEPGHTAVTASTLAADGEPVEVTVTDDLTTLAFPALKALAAELGLAKGGTKAQLIARINEHKATVE